MVDVICAEHKPCTVIVSASWHSYTVACQQVYQQYERYAASFALSVVNLQDNRDFLDLSICDMEYKHTHMRDS